MSVGSYLLFCGNDNVHEEIIYQTGEPFHDFKNDSFLGEFCSEKEAQKEAIEQQEKNYEWCCVVKLKQEI